MAIFGSGKKVRYAVVGLGWIAQEVVLPAFNNTDNSELTAFVTGDSEKAEKLGEEYEVSRSVGYAGYDQLLQSGAVDAVYIALPNSMHLDYTLRAARAGVHVLCEKPMADSVAECQQMIDACDENKVKLMIAYRLHLEPANLAAVEAIADGEIGEPRIFNSVFSQQVAAGNVRLKKALGGGPLMDMGVYPINACRYLFRDEPTEVTALGATREDERFTEVHEMVSAILRFPGDRLATLTSSFGAADSDAFQVVGTKGELWLKPAFDYHNKSKMIVKVNGKEKETRFGAVDQFGGEIEYFSQCIINDKEPEPSGREGLADIRIVEAIMKSIRSGQPVKLEPFEKSSGPGKGQKYEKSAIKTGKIVNAASPGE